MARFLYVIAQNYIQHRKQMRQCKDCGASNPIDAHYCNVCGHRLKRNAGDASCVWAWLLGLTSLALGALCIATWLQLRQAQENLDAHNSIAQTLAKRYDASLDSLRDECFRLDAQKCSAEHRLNDFQEMVGRTYPLIIDSIKIGNVNRIQQVQTEFGQPIYSDETMYLQPRIYYRGIRHGNIDLYVKWYDPEGNLRTGESSPTGFSQKDECYIYEENKSLNLKGWGSETRGNWRSGSYRLEVWHHGMLLAQKHFRIY